MMMCMNWNSVDYVETENDTQLGLCLYFIANCLLIYYARKVPTPFPAETVFLERLILLIIQRQVIQYKYPLVFILLLNLNYHR